MDAGSLQHWAPPHTECRLQGQCERFVKGVFMLNPWKCCCSIYTSTEIVLGWEMRQSQGGKATRPRMSWVHFEVGKAELESSLPLLPQGSCIATITAHVGAGPADFVESTVEVCHRTLLNPCTAPLSIWQCTGPKPSSFCMGNAVAGRRTAASWSMISFLRSDLWWRVRLWWRSSTPAPQTLATLLQQQSRIPMWSRRNLPRSLGGGLRS